MRYMLLAIVLGLNVGCSPGRQQLTDLSDRVARTPADGIGHYVYALTAAETVEPGTNYKIGMEWRTVGPAKPNQRYSMDIRLRGPATKIYEVSSAANTIGEYHLTNWLEHSFPISPGFPTGSYEVEVRVIDLDGVTQELGYREEFKRTEGFYALTSVVVE